MDEKDEVVKEEGIEEENKEKKVVKPKNSLMEIKVVATETAEQIVNGEDEAISDRTILVAIHNDLQKIKKALL